MENQLFTDNSNFGFKSEDQNEIHLPMPNNYMALSIISTILGICGSICCINLILGIIAIVFSAQVKTKYNRGDYYGALKASKNAKILSIIALVLGVIGLAANIVKLSLYGLDSYMTQYENLINGNY